MVHSHIHAYVVFALSLCGFYLHIFSRASQTYSGLILGNRTESHCVLFCSLLRNNLCSLRVIFTIHRGQVLLGFSGSFATAVCLVISRSLRCICMTDSDWLKSMQKARSSTKSLRLGLSFQDRRSSAHPYPSRQE